MQPIHLTDSEKRDIIKSVEDGRALPERYRWLLFEDKKQVELVWNGKPTEVTKSVARQCPAGRRKIAVKVVDIFGNDTMKVIEVTV